MAGKRKNITDKLKEQINTNVDDANAEELPKQSEEKSEKPKQKKAKAEKSETTEKPETIEPVKPKKRKFKVIALGVSLDYKKTAKNGDIVNEDEFVVRNVDELLRGGYIKEV